VKLIQTLFNQSQESFNYVFEAKLDVGTFVPEIHVQEKGEFSPFENIQ